jgi:hypothetical protein
MRKVSILTLGFALVGASAPFSDCLAQGSKTSDRTKRRPVGVAIVLLSLLQACSERPEQVRPETPPSHRAPTQILDVVRSLPPAAPAESLKVRIDTLLLEIERSTKDEMPIVRQAIDVLRAQPRAIESLTSYYASLPVLDRGRRGLALQILGELRSERALPFLLRVVQGALPARDRTHDLSTRDLEEIVHVRAVHAIGYLRTPRAYQELIRIMQTHDAFAVRIAAIDTFMWNQGDTGEKAAELQAILPDSLHPYIERPRFYSGMDMYAFDERLAEWRKRWGNRIP